MEADAEGGGEVEESWGVLVMIFKKLGRWRDMLALRCSG